MAVVMSTQGLTKTFGGLVAVDHVDINVQEGEMLGLLGPNGSGKTTLFNCISGFYEPDGGTVIFEDQDITGMPMENISEQGLYRTFQLPRVFPDLSVLKNVLLSQPHRHESIGDILFRSTDEEHIRQARDWIDFVGLTRLIDEPAGNLSGGQKKLLEFASALMKDPTLIMLDEPMGGVNPSLITKLKDLLTELCQLGKTLFIIEHNMEVIMDIAERLYVLCEGRVIAEGTPSEIRNNDEVLEAYFGS